MREAAPVATNESHKGCYFRTTKRTRTRSGLLVPAKQLALAVEDPLDGWLPVLFRGNVEYVRLANVKAVPLRKVKTA